MAKKEVGENGEIQSRVSTEIIKCPSCGGNMEFDPDSQMLLCSHCGTKQSFASDLKAEELDLVSGFISDKKWEDEESSVFRCSNCGAKVILSANETAKVCPFCGTAHVESEEEIAGVKPNAVLPFSLGFEQALEKVKFWAKKKLFAPKKFKNNLDADNLRGVYMPSFTFDSFTTSVYAGKIGRDYVVTVGSGKNRHTETRIEWKYVSGTFYDNFDDVLITAGSKFGQKEMKKVSPFDTNGSKVYESSYLLGFMAYHYDRELVDCWEDAKTEMDKAIKKGILDLYPGYTHVSYLNVSTSHEKVTYKYVMLPVYLGNFNYSNKNYNFYVNGSTGKVWGKTPISALKVLLTSVLGIAVVGGLIFLILSFLK